MPFFIPALIAGASALGGLLGNRKSIQTQQSSSDQSGSFDNFSLPQFGQASDLNIEMSRLLPKLYQESSDLSGYIGTGLRNINSAGNTRLKAINNALASRGLSWSPVGAALEQEEETKRIGDQVNFLSQAPLLKRSMQREDLDNLFNYINLNRGLHNTGTFTQRGTNSGSVTNPGNMAGGFFGGLGQSLAGLYGQGAFDSDLGGSGFKTPGGGRSSNPIY